MNSKCSSCSDQQ